MTKSTAKPVALPESAVTTNPARMVAATERHIHEIVHSSKVSMCMCRRVEREVRLLLQYFEAGCSQGGTPPSLCQPP